MNSAMSALILFGGLAAAMALFAYFAFAVKMPLAIAYGCLFNGFCSLAWSLRVLWELHSTVIEPRYSITDAAIMLGVGLLFLTGGFFMWRKERKN